MNSVLITGASGFIGQYLVRQLQNNPVYDVSGAYNARRPQQEGCRWFSLDLTNHAQLEDLFEQVQPDVVAHLAAESDISKAEADPERARAINVTGTDWVARLCAQHGARMVFLSTDYVFPGDRGRYREDETPSPTTYYGQTKWEAEQAIRSHLSDWSIIRTTLVYGWPPLGCHANLATAVIKCLESGRPFYGYTDMYRTPTYVRDVAVAIIKLMQEGRRGIYHVVGPEWINMYHFASATAGMFHLDSRLIMPSLSPTDNNQTPRPKLLGLDATETGNKLGIRFTSMVSGLEQMQNERRIQSWLQQR